MKKNAYKSLYEVRLDFDTLERLVSEEKELPRQARLEDVCAYEAMKYIYSSWRRGAVEREKAKRVMHLLARAHKQVQDNIRRSEGLRRKLIFEMRQNSDELACNALLCIGYMRCDEVFVSEVKKYFEKSKEG